MLTSVDSSVKIFFVFLDTFCSFAKFMLRLRHNNGNMGLKGVVAMSENSMARKIKELRLARGLTLEQVATIVGVGKSTVRKWETGMIANMRRDKIAALAKALGVTPEYLMGWEEQKEISPAKPELSEGEKMMLELFRKIPEDRQPEALELLRVALKML